MLIGGSLTLSYQLIFDILRHHEESNNDRPVYFDHMTALTIIGTVTAGFVGGAPRFFFIGGFMSAFVIAPGTWWIYKHGRLNSNNRSSNIFYEDSVTRDEVERIQHLDEIESMGAYMLA